MKKLLIILTILFLYGETHSQTPTKKKIKISDIILNVEVADTDGVRQKGLMYRKNLKDDEGMLFVFDEQKKLSFWMKNTVIPLSIGFFDKNKKLVDIQDMQPASPMDLSPPIYQSKKAALYALEVSLGWFRKHKIKLGSDFQFIPLSK